MALRTTNVSARVRAAIERAQEIESIRGGDAPEPKIHLEGGLTPRNLNLDVTDPRNLANKYGPRRRRR